MAATPETCRNRALRLGAVILAAALLGSAAPLSARPLSFEARLEGRRAVEAVYWRHRSWPQENRAAKPSLADVLPEPALRAKVEESLRKSRALELHWSRPLTRDQLQAELERMARATRRPELLREIWQSLGDDPALIAECVARPLLADRLLRHWYAFDAREHGAQRARIERELAGCATARDLRQTSGAYRELEWVRGASPAQPEVVATGAIPPGKSPAADCAEPRVLDERAWGQLLARLGEARCREDVRRSASAISLREDAELFFAERILDRTPDRVKVARVQWRKAPFEAWWEKARASFDPEVAVPAGAHRLPVLAQASVCDDDTWTPTAGVPERSGHTAVWTGSEMLAWGGCINNAPCTTNSGIRYDPATDTWAPMSDVDAPTARGNHTAVWTGEEMIVWGGWDFASNDIPIFNTGGRYDPATDTWTPTSTASAPGKRRYHSAVWTGNQMIVWGGEGCLELTDCIGALLSSGGRYDPSTDTWQPTSNELVLNPAPEARRFHTAIWTGSRMVVWGGETNNVYLGTGGVYDPVSDRWTSGGTSTTGAPGPRVYHTGIWTGDRMVVWGGYDGAPLGTGGVYDPATNQWVRPTSNSDAPDGRYGHTMVWTGSRMIIWGGYTGFIENTGGIYDPAADDWQPTSTVNAPLNRDNHTAVWSGSEMIVWGGSLISSFLATGGRYDPATNSWIPTSTAGAPDGRDQHVAVWTGVEMIIWGGCAQLACGFSFPNPSAGPTNTGSRYDPVTDSWTATPTSGAPIGRKSHAAVWTGSEMIVWGGDPMTGQTTATGGRYNPAADTWTPTQEAGAAQSRAHHIAVWTGSEMIVWGGFSCEDPDGCSTSPYLDTGGRYDPVADAWRPTSTANAPSLRVDPTAVWTGAEMILWGGYGCTNPPACDQQSVLDDGGRYDPVADTWRVVSTTDAPDPRILHTAVWTGTEMIIWGAGNYSQENTGGRYQPATDSWTPTTTTGAPDPRFGHEAVWTGSEMIVWGGDDSDLFGSNSGGRYDPMTDSWRPTSMVGAPGDRSVFTAVWTGRQMIVWGGSSITESATGGLYCARAEPTPVLVSLVEARAEPGRVTLVWHSVDTDAATLYRCEESGTWTPLASLLPDGAGRMTHADRDVATGRRYGYRLGIWREGSEVFAGEVWVDVPGAFALEVGGGNPASGDPVIWFSLPDAEPARLELMDVAGRRVLLRQVGSYGAGKHTIALSARAGFSPGLYLVRLSQSGRSATTKLVVTNR